MEISFLSEQLRHAAIPTANGEEVMWPREVAAEAVNELADQGVIVLGLDLRSDGDGATPNGLATEIPWSAYDGDDVEGGREAALAALTSPSLVDFDGYRWVLVTW